MSVNGIGGSGGPGSVNGPKGPGGTGGPISPPPGDDSKASGGPKKQDLITSKLMKIIHAEPEIRSDLVDKYKNLITSNGQRGFIKRKIQICYRHCGNRCFRQASL